MYIKTFIKHTKLGVLVLKLLFVSVGKWSFPALEAKTNRPTKPHPPSVFAGGFWAKADRESTGAVGFGSSSSSWFCFSGDV